MIFDKIKLIKDSIAELFAIRGYVSGIQENQRRCYLEDQILHCKEPGITNRRYADCDIIVSLTSYGSRMYEVCFAIESIMQQTIKPNKIILWIDNSYKDKPIPEALLKQQERGLIIKFTDDIRSYKKLVPTLELYPNDVIITIDDDAYYQFDLIERMIKAYKCNPSSIHACNTPVMQLDDKGKLKPYLQWMRNSSNSDNSQRLFFVGVGGVLYPPHSLDTEVLNKAIFTSICPTADDVWFNAMALKKGTLVNKVETRNIDGDFILNRVAQKVRLSNVNNGMGMNDVQIKAVFERYDLYKVLK
jgi:hypothetical protein